MVVDMMAMMVQLLDLNPTSKRGHATPPRLATWHARGPTRRWGRGRRSRGGTPRTQDLLTPGNRLDRQPVEFHIIEFVFCPGLQSITSISYPFHHLPMERPGHWREDAKAL